MTFESTVRRSRGLEAVYLDAVDAPVRPVVPDADSSAPVRLRASTTVGG